MKDIDPSAQQIKILPENSLTSIIEQQKHLFWWVPENKLTQLSIDAVVEAVLNNGNEKAVRHLFDILGVEKVAELFYRQTSGKRTNYRPRTIHFFRSYFQQHAQRYSNEPVAKVLKREEFVIPTKVGIQSFQCVAKISGFPFARE